MNNGTTEYVYYKYLEINGAELFTVVCLPQSCGTFPTVIYRNPYVDAAEQQTEGEICTDKLREYKSWLDHGYAVVFQHCRGRGKSRRATGCSQCSGTERSFSFPRLERR